MSQKPIIRRASEEALAVLLMIEALGFASLFPVVRKATNRFIKSTVKDDECVGGKNETLRKQEVLHEQSHIESPEAALPTGSSHTAMDGNSDGQFQHVKSDAQAAQITSAQGDLNREKGLNAIRAWQEAERSRTGHEVLRNSEACSTISQRKRWEATQARKQATIMREIAWNDGVQAVKAWERTMTNGSRREQVDRLEVTPLAEEEGRLFVWPDAQASRLLCFRWSLGDA
ncbi:hypothetical protein BDR22DRAFT_890404 [Usnea florida]